MKSKKNILIIGGTGFIGYHLAKNSIKRKWNVTSISSKLPKKKRYLKKVKYIRCDITNKNLLEKKINKKFDYVVNLGGYVDHSNKKKTLNSHYQGSKNLTEIFLKNRPISFIQVGSSLEYGSSKSPQKESISCNLKSIKSTYGKAKLLASMHMMNLFKKKKFPATVIRFYLVYGPRQDVNRFLPIIITGCVKNKKFPCSTGEQLRDFIYVEDVAHAFISACEKKIDSGVYNLGSGESTSIYKICKIVESQLTGSTSFSKKLNEISSKQEEINFWADNSKSIKAFSWNPKVTLKRGIQNQIISMQK